MSRRLTRNSAPYPTKDIKDSCKPVDEIFKLEDSGKNYVAFRDGVWNPKEAQETWIHKQINKGLNKAVEDSLCLPEHQDILTKSYAAIRLIDPKINKNFGSENIRPERIRKDLPKRLIGAINVIAETDFAMLDETYDSLEYDLEQFAEAIQVCGTKKEYRSNIDEKFLERARLIIDRANAKSTIDKSSILTLAFLEILAKTGNFHGDKKMAKDALKYINNGAVPRLKKTDCLDVGAISFIYPTHKVKVIYEAEDLSQHQDIYHRGTELFFHDPTCCDFSPSTGLRWKGEKKKRVIQLIFFENGEIRHAQ